MRDDLMPGDILMYRSGQGWLGRTICMGEWSNTPQEAIEYCHVGIVLSPVGDQGFEMNPPSSHYTVLSKQDWSVIDVWRPKVPIKAPILADWAMRNNGIKYPFPKIAQFFCAGILARLGLNKASRWMADRGDPEDHKQMVCSATVCEMLSEASGENMGWPRHDADMRPADIPLGRVSKI